MSQQALEFILGYYFFEQQKKTSSYIAVGMNNNTGDSTKQIAATVVW